MSERGKIVVLIPLLFLWGISAEAEDKPLFILEITVSGTKAEVFVNGFPYLTAPGRVSHSSSGIANVLFREGENKLRIILSPASPGAYPADTAPDGVRQPSSSRGSLSIRLNKSQVESSTRRIVPGNSVVALNYRDRAGDASIGGIAKSPVPGGGPAQTSQADHIELNLSFIVDAFPVKELLWEGTPPPLSDAEKNAISTIVSMLERALSDRNIETLKKIMRIKNLHYAKAMCTDLNTVESEQEKFFRRLWSDPGFSIRPVDKSEMHFETIGGLNLVKVTKDSGPPVSVQLRDSKFKMETYFSHIDGKWEIVH